VIFTTDGLPGAAALPAQKVGQLSNARICVVAGGLSEST
jgi:hypothetical protein